VPKIAIVWDFDGTLTPQDSTTKVVVDILQAYQSANKFWKYVKGLRGNSRKPTWEHVLASDAPIWMYALSRIAYRNRVPLNAEFFEEFVRPHISLYDGVLPFLRKLKRIEKTTLFRESKLEIHFFIITAGLKELVELLFPKNLITWTFGCRYEVVVAEEGGGPESIPVFCMDETMKTRSLFEISKGSFADKEHAVNRRVPVEELWAPFENIMYIGDGDTDVPALSLTRRQGGLGVVVYNPSKSKYAVNKRLKQMTLDKRADIITPAKFEETGELFDFLQTRCRQIALRYRAQKSV
jgi:2-hydroxy-3-keto-5-methylthiopentenyl-1-phosphate phosphatase